MLAPRHTAPKAALNWQPLCTAPLHYTGPDTLSRGAPALDGSTAGHHLVRVDAARRLLAKELAHDFAHLRTTPARSPRTLQPAAACSTAQAAAARLHWHAQAQQMCGGPRAAPADCRAGACLGHARHAAHEQHFLDVRGRHARILQAVLARLLGARQQVRHQRLEAGACDHQAQVLGARLPRHTARQPGRRPQARALPARVP